MGKREQKVLKSSVLPATLHGVVCEERLVIR